MSSTGAAVLLCVLFAAIFANGVVVGAVVVMLASTRVLECVFGVAIVKGFSSIVTVTEVSVDR